MWSLSLGVTLAPEFVYSRFWMLFRGKLCGEYFFCFEFLKDNWFVLIITVVENTNFNIIKIYYC
jgi:hypothetical protein